MGENRARKRRNMLAAGSKGLHGRIPRAKVVVMMMFIGTETLVTQLVFCCPAAAPSPLNRARAQRGRAFWLFGGGFATMVGYVETVR